MKDLDLVHTDKLYVGMRIKNSFIVKEIYADPKPRIEKRGRPRKQSN